MDHRFNMARMGQVTKQRNAAVGLLISVLILNILQLIERMTVSEKIILLPPDIKKDVSVEKKRVSDSYIEEWTIYLSQLLLNVSPETINYQRDMTLRNVSPDAYSPIKAQFEEDRERLTKNRAATTFSPMQVEVNGETLTAKITGLLSTHVGKEKISEHKETFVLNFALTGWGKLQLQSFKKLSDIQEENHAGQ